VVIDFWVDNNNISPGACTTLRWHVEHANAVHLDGVGVAGDGTKQICPGSTTIYVLHVAHDAGATEKKVTVKVTGGGAPAPTPTPTLILVQPISVDLAVTDLFADKQVQGKVFARITNHGPDSATNANVQLFCSAQVVDSSNNPQPAVANSSQVNVSLNPGQTKEFNTGITVDTTKYWYVFTCDISTPGQFLGDDKPGNNNYTEKIP
jgi:hypothetical protein